ncbi:hypothetical protein [Novosphingobium sp. Gsoil 351]|uniref:hypothetical protein n=1 Tax=Novosphingobium sp. Gsoil 351 TaxID=2675225 RepID=UPI001E2B615C|nr:hypothetical protein [Novosphingobium sp. Gsoil 351]
MDDHTDARIGPGPFGQCGERGRVVATAAGVDAQFLLRPACPAMAVHRGDDLGFAPGGNQHGCDTLERCIGRVGKGPRSRLPRQLEPEPGKIDPQFVDRADKEEERGEEQELMLDNLKPLPRVEPGEVEPSCHAPAAAHPKRSSAALSRASVGCNVSPFGRCTSV